MEIILSELAKGTLALLAHNYNHLITCTGATPEQSERAERCRDELFAEIRSRSDA